MLKDAIRIVLGIAYPRRGTALEDGVGSPAVWEERCPPRTEPDPAMRIEADGGESLRFWARSEAATGIGLSGRGRG